MTIQNLGKVFRGFNNLLRVRDRLTMFERLADNRVCPRDPLDRFLLLGFPADADNGASESEVVDGSRNPRIAAQIFGEQADKTMKSLHRLRELLERDVPAQGERYRVCIHGRASRIILVRQPTIVNPTPKRRPAMPD